MRKVIEPLLFSRRTFSRNVVVVFGIIALATVQTGGSAPTPIYRLYQQDLGLSPFLVTVIFAVYPLSLLASLLTVGSLSDHIGRRPVMLAAMLLSAVAMGLFASTGSFAGLVVARTLQGLATGAAASSLGAAILDVRPQTGSLVNSVTAFAGTTIGAILSSVLVAFAPEPTRLVYALLLVAFLALAAMAHWLPETASPGENGRPSFRPHVDLPAHVQRAFWMVSPVNIAGWALGGFYLSLMPALFRVATGIDSPLLGGAVIASLTLSGALSIAAWRNSTARDILSRGAVALVVGVAVTLVGVHGANTALLATGTLIAGVGFGASFYGAARTILPLAQPHERAGVLSAFFVESYLAFAVPAVIIALLAPEIGLIPAAYVYGGVVMALAVVSLIATRMSTARRTASAAG